MKGKRVLQSIALVLCFSVLIGQSNASQAAANYGTYSKPAIKKRIVVQAINHGLDPALALSVAKQESGFDKEAKSYVGAIGLFQLMPETAKDLGVNPYYLNQNIKGGIKYLKTLKTQFGSTEKALAAYNAGPGAVQKYGGVPPYRETKHYVKNIMGFYKDYKANPDPIIDQVKTEIAQKQMQDDEKVAVINVYNNKSDESNINQDDQSNDDSQNSISDLVQEKKTNIAFDFFSKIFNFFS